MITKLIQIAVPLEWEVPQILNTLNAEENALILKTGGEMIKEARNLVAGLSQKEIYNKIREESKSEIQKLELDLLVEKQLATKSIEQSNKIYESQINSLEKQISELNKQLTEHTNNSKLLIQQEVDKEKDKYKVLLEDKNKQVLRITENYENFLKQTDTK